MTAAMKVFTYPNQGRVRVVQQDGQSLWVLRDVCAVTATDVQRFRTLPEDVRRYVMVEGVLGQAMKALTCQGLYKLLYRGDRTPEAARAFLDWLDDVALPEIEGQVSDEIQAPEIVRPQPQHEASPLRFCVLTISNLMSDDPNTRRAAKDDALQLINLIAKLLEEKAAA